MKLVRCKRMIPNIMKMVVPNQLYCNFGTYDSLLMLDDDKMFAANKEKSSIQLTQEKQQISVNSLMQSNVSTDEIAISTVRNTLKKLEGQPDLISDYQNSLEELDNKLVQKRTNNTDDNNQYLTIYNNCNPRLNLCSPMTGVNTKKGKKKKRCMVFCKFINIYIK